MRQALKCDFNEQAADIECDNRDPPSQRCQRPLPARANGHWGNKVVPLGRPAARKTTIHETGGATPHRGLARGRDAATGASGGVHVAVAIRRGDGNEGGGLTAGEEEEHGGRRDGCVVYGSGRMRSIVVDARD